MLQKGIASCRVFLYGELEINQQLENRSDKRTKGFYVPSNARSKRAYVAWTPNAASNLVSTYLLADNFIEVSQKKKDCCW